MIRLSEIKAGISNDDSLTSLYLSDNVLETVVGRDLEFGGAAAVRMTATGGLQFRNGTEGTIGDVLTSVDTVGTAQWVTNPNNLQFAYQALNTITTNATFGDVTIAGTEAFRVTTAGGILASEITTDGYDLVIGGAEDIRITTNLLLQDGSEGVDGYVWTSQGVAGLGSWELPVSTLQQAYENDNLILLEPGLDLIVDGYAGFDVHTPTRLFGRVDAYGDAYFVGPNLCIESSVKIDDGTQVDGHVLTTDASGNATWQEPVSDLQGAYETSNTLTTSVGFGDLIIDGTETVIINTAGGLDVNETLDVDADAYFTGPVIITGDVDLTGEINLKDGSEGTAGDFWTSTDTSGRGSWTALPAATSSTAGTISRESDSGESTIPGTLTWNDSNAPTGLIYKFFRCIRTGNRVDIWFNAKYTTPNAGSSTGVSFPFPAGCPTPTLWSNNAADEIITYGTGRVFESSDGTDTADQDQTTEVTLHHNSSVFTVSITSFKRVVNNYGSHTQVPLNPIGFNAQITYFTDA